MEMIELNTIYNEDCLEGMKRIPDGSVDMVLCDLPYGTTQLKWDTCLPFDKLWEQWLRVCKTNAAIVLFSSQPFTTDLINSNRKMFKYEIIWEKTMKSLFFLANKRPLVSHENLLVFYRHQPVYNPIKNHVEEKQRIRYQQANRSKHYHNNHEHYYENDGSRFPTTVIKFSNWNGALFGKTDTAVKHPTQKPVDLCEYLIKTYTNEGDTVLDNCMGSGTTAVACINTGRNYIGFELDQDYFDISQQRIKDVLHPMQTKLQFN